MRRLKYSCIAAVLLIAALIFTGCSGTPSVYATIDGHDITREEFEFQLNVRRIHNPSQEFTKEEQLELLQQFIDEHLMLVEARKRNLEVDTEEAQKSFDSFRQGLIRNQFDNSETRYQTRLQELRIRESDILRLFSDYELILALLDVEREALADPDEQKIQDYYNARRSNVFTLPEERRIRHILVNDKSFDSEDLDGLNGEEAWAKIEELADDIYSQLEAGGDFESLAKRYSADTTSAVKGGELDWSKKAAFVPEFGGEAFKLEVGELSEPVESEFGLHIIEVLEIKPPSFMPLDDELEEQIIMVLRAEAWEKHLLDFLDELNDAASIKRNYK